MRLHFPLQELLLLLLLSQQTTACQPQVCRRRRAVLDGTVKLNLEGCSKETPPWMRQVAFCLNLRVVGMAATIKTWYRINYEVCELKGCQRYVLGGRDKSSVEDCVSCWKDLLRDAPFVKDPSRKITIKTIEECVDKFIYAYLENDLPTLESESRFKHTILLSEVRPAEYWWSVTVRLPCKPRTFIYWNAYCTNSFAKELQEGDYVLVKNNLITTQDQLSFFAEFTDECNFEPEDIVILWNESFPAHALPQISSFPSQYPPLENESASLYFDRDAAIRLRMTDGGMPEEYQISKKAVLKSRKTRSIPNGDFSRLGLKFPCAVKSFKLEDTYEKSFQLDGSGDKFLIYINKTKFDGSRSRMNFTLDYGYFETRCIFQSKDVEIVANPPRNWINSKPLRKQKNGMTCSTCINAKNDLDCLHMGYKRSCAKNEVCQTEVRQITQDLRLITKSCKQKRACTMDSLNFSPHQCKPGIPGSVCQCCCETSMCNKGVNPCSLQRYRPKTLMFKHRRNRP